jgi:hypothetical protein
VAVFKRAEGIGADAWYVSLLAAAGHTLLEVARRAGHSVDTCERYYAKIFDDVDPANRVDPEDAIRLAREPGHSGRRATLRRHRGRQVVTSYTSRIRLAPTGGRWTAMGGELDMPQVQGLCDRADERIRTADPFITSVKRGVAVSSVG